MPNLYSILELEPGAAPAAVKAAYRRLALKYHPDRQELSQGALAADLEGGVERMAEVNLAFSILSDPVKRELYDRRLATTHSRPMSGDRQPAVWATEEPDVYRPVERYSDLSPPEPGYDELYYGGLRFFSQGDVFGRREQLVKDAQIKRTYLRRQVSCYLKAKTNLERFVAVVPEGTMSDDARGKLRSLEKIIAIQQDELRRRPLT